jgi:hypothetical protein
MHMQTSPLLSGLFRAADSVLVAISFGGQALAKQAVALLEIYPGDQRTGLALAEVTNWTIRIFV